MVTMLGIHGGSLGMAVVSTFVPASRYCVVLIVGPLVVYVLKKDESKFVAFHALQQLIFDAILLPVILIIAVVTCGFGAVLVFVPLVFQIIAALRANDGEYYELPVAGAIARKSVYGA